MGEGVALDDLETIEGPAFVGNYARIAPNASVGPYSVLMNSVTVRDHAKTSRSVIDASTSIGRSVAHRRRDRREGLRPSRARARCTRAWPWATSCTIGEESVVMPGVRIYPFKEVESGALVDRNLIWESRGSRRG